MQNAVATCGNELRRLGELLDEQTAAGLDRGETLDALFEGKKASLAKFHGASECEKDFLSKAIHEGPWCDRQRAALIKVLTGGADKKAPKDAARRRDTQNAPQFENLVHEKLWIDLRNVQKYSPASRCHMLARLAAMLGICLPSPKLLYRMVQILAYAAEEYDLSQEKVFEHMDRIQDFIKGYKQEAGTPFITMYPPIAEELEAVFLERAYRDCDLPVQVNIPELDTVLGKAKMRGRGKDMAWFKNVPEHLQKDLMADHPELVQRGMRRRFSKGSPGAVASARAAREPAHEKAHFASQPAPSAGYVTGDMLQHQKTALVLPDPPTTAVERPPFGILAATAAPIVDTSGWCNECGAEVRTTAPPNEKARSGGAVDATHVHASGGVADATIGSADAVPTTKAASPPVGSVEEMEQKMAAAGEARKVDATLKGKAILKAKASGPKGKAAPKAKGGAKAGAAKASVKKRACAKAGAAKASVKKRPAAAVVKTDAAGNPFMKDVFDRMEIDFPNLSRNTFTCRAYDAAERRWAQLGLPAGRMKEFRTAQYEKAQMLHRRLSER